MITIEYVRERLASSEGLREHNIRKMAEIDLKDHKITELSKPEDYARVFRCSREGSGSYGFKVVVWPYFISIHGDVGGLTLSRCEDMIDWCRSAINSPGYFFQKSDPRSQAIKTFCETKFIHWLRDQVANDEDGEWTDEKLVECYELIETGDPSTTSRITEFLMEEMGDGDAWEYGSLFEDYESNLWWCLEAIRKFLQLYDEMKAVNSLD